MSVAAQTKDIDPRLLEPAAERGRGFGLGAETPQPGPEEPPVKFPLCVIQVEKGGSMLSLGGDSG